MSAALRGFKWVRPSGHSWHDESFGPYVVGKTLSVTDAKRGDACGHGLHIGKTAAHAIGYGKFPGRLFAVEGIGEVLGHDETKLRVAECRVIEELEKPAWVVNVEAFVESIKTVQFFKPRQRPLKAWKHHKTRKAAWDAAWGAARDAAWDAAWDAAMDAALNAAWGAARDAARDAAWDAAVDAALNAAVDAAWDAARDAVVDAAVDAARDAALNAARDAAGDAAWGAARDAAWDAARDAAGDAARDAARDADLMALDAITADLDDPNAAKHRKHIRARWKVWQMGYGLACDVNGKLYTYGKGPK